MAKVVVVGLGKSGISATRLLAGKGDNVFVTEMRDDSSVRTTVEALIKDNVVRENNVELGFHSREIVEQADLMVVSPGVRRDSLAIRLAEEKDIPVISELELSASMCPVPIIGITGTSGKTTVTTLIGKMIRGSGRDVVLCGNIGNPLSAEIENIKHNSVVILEVSSFQLEWIRGFRPRISVVLNISANHLDRHRDMDEYISLKSRIFSNQDREDIVLLNGKDTILREISRNIKSRVLFFDEYKGFAYRYNIENENYLAAMSVASCEGVSEDLMLDVISNFKGIEHRLEYVKTVDGVDFFNDSKATTVSSVEWALRYLSPIIILIMGGRYKGGDFSRLNDLVRKKVDCVIAIGEARSKIREDMSGVTDVIEKEDMKDAVDAAFRIAKKGSHILLSPGCSSFDMFTDYEERGRVFKDSVNRLTG